MSKLTLKYFQNLIATQNGYDDWDSVWDASLYQPADSRQKFMASFIEKSTEAYAKHLLSLVEDKTTKTQE